MCTSLAHFLLDGIAQGVMPARASFTRSSRGREAENVCLADRRARRTYCFAPVKQTRPLQGLFLICHRSKNCLLLAPRYNKFTRLCRLEYITHNFQYASSAAASAAELQDYSTMPAVSAMRKHSCSKPQCKLCNTGRQRQKLFQRSSRGEQRHYRHRRSTALE